MTRDRIRVRPGEAGDGDSEVIVRALLEECLRRGEVEGLRAVEELVARHPAQADVVRRRLRLLHEFGLFRPR